MENREFSRRLGEVIDVFDSSDFDCSLRLARSLKKELLAGKTIDPMQLGWARYYEFKNLYELGEYADAYKLLKSTENVPYIVTTVNAGWMNSIGTELAYRLGKADEIPELGKRCIEQYMIAKEEGGAVLCAKNCIMFFDKLKRPDLKLYFEGFLKERGEETE